MNWDLAIKLLASYGELVGAAFLMAILVAKILARRKRIAIVLVFILLVIPGVILGSIYLWFPLIPGSGIAHITEVIPPDRVIGKNGIYSIKGEVDQVRIPPGWELFAIKMGSDAYWRVHIQPVSMDEWEREMYDGAFDPTSERFSRDERFDVVIGLASPALQNAWQMHGEGDISYQEIPLREPDWIFQDKVEMFRPAILAVKVTFPVDNTPVPQEIYVRGWANKEPEGHLYIVVEHEGEWWPQYGEVSLNLSQVTKRYEFDHLVSVGEKEDSGKTFLIRAVLVDSAVHVGFVLWLEVPPWEDGIPISKVNQWGEVEVYDTVTVTRQ